MGKRTELEESEIIKAHEELVAASYQLSDADEYQTVKARTAIEAARQGLVNLQVALLLKSR